MMKIRVKNTYQYIQLMNGLFNMTDTEMKILACFIDVHDKVTEAGVELNTFATDIKKQVAKVMKRKDFNTLNNYIKRMHDKKVIQKTINGYKIHKMLRPSKEGKVTLEVEWINSK